MSTPLPSTGAYQTVYQPNVVYTVPPEQYTVPPQQYFVPAEQYSVIPPQQYTPLEQTPEKPARFGTALSLSLSLSLSLFSFIPIVGFCGRKTLLPISCTNASG